MPLTLSPAEFTSVTWTSAASASPSWTFASVDFTSASRDTGLTATPALPSTVCASAPHGTCGWHSTTLAPGLARSARAPILAGFDGGTAISSTFLANGVEVFAALASTSCCMFFGDAEANASAGAPWVICWASAELAPKLKVTFVPGWAVSKAWPIAVKDSLSDAAAKTLRLPDREPLGLAAAAAVDVLEEPELPPPQPARARATAVTRTPESLGRIW